MQLPELAATDYCKISFTLRSNSAALEEPMSRFQTVFAARERRGAFRYDVRVKATIAFGDKTPSIECVIRDISQTGAMLEVDPSVLPDDFTLVFSRQCRVVRRSADGTKLGVEFLLPWSVTV